MEFEKVLKICELYDIIKNFKNREEHIIDENKENLSTGQMARIALARAIYSRKSILILDEIFKSIDDYTTVKILNNLKREDLMIIIVSHKNIIDEKFYNKKIVLKEGGNFYKKVN